jgi:hypothetical protein
MEATVHNQITSRVMDIIRQKSSLWLVLNMAVALCMTCSGLAHAVSALRVSVDMPHGGCSLTAFEDGSASIHYGAMPRWIRVAADAFNFKQLVTDLRDRSYAQSTQSPRKESAGSVMLPNSEDLLWIDDREFVKSLLARAPGSRVTFLKRLQISRTTLGYPKHVHCGSCVV